MTSWNRGKLLYISLADLSLPNGPGINEREFAIGLRERFADNAILVAPEPSGSNQDVRNLEILSFSNPRRWDLWGFCRQQVELRTKLRNLLASEQIAGIVCRLSVLPWAIAKLDRGDIPMFVKTLGEIDGFTRNLGLKGFIARRLAPINRRLYREVLSQADGIDCCTDILLRRVKQEYGVESERLRLVENATNVRRFSPSPSKAHCKQQLGLDRFDQVLGFVGGAAGDRGGTAILDTLAQLRAEFPGLGAAIVGRDPDNRLLRRAEQLGIEDRVAIPGLVPYEQVPTYVNSFDIAYAVDSAERFSEVGNSYQKVRQYLACGIPVITCVSDPSSFLVTENLAVTVESDDPNAVEQATRQVLGWNQQIRDDHAARAVAYTREHLSVEATLRQRLEFWRQRSENRRKRHSVARAA